MKVYPRPIRALGGLVVAGFAVTFAATMAFAAGNPEAGKAKATTICAACHGVDGNSVAPTFPRLAGQHREYLLHALQAYRSGTRKNEIMKAQVVALTPEDMENLAAYYSKQKGLEVKR